MKMLKNITVLLFIAAMFFSCTENDDYGTLLINPSGSSRAIKGEVDSGFYEGFENGLTYTFTCINQNDTSKVKSAGPYDFGKSSNVEIQLNSGKWDVWVKVNKNGKEIGSSKYPTVTIKAGDTVVLKGTNIEIQGYSYGSAVAHKVPDNFNLDVNSPYWDDTPPLKINRFIKLNESGYANPPIVDPNGTGAHGNAKILWDDSGNGHLYVLVLVEGNEPTEDKGEQEHDSDSVEIFVYEGGNVAHQYRKNFAGTNTYGKVTRSSSSSTNWTEAVNPTFPDTVSLEIKKSPTDNLPNGVKYAVIAKIPFDTKKKSGNKIGVELQINGTPLKKDESGKDRRTTVAVWCSETSPYKEPWRYENSLVLTN